MRSPWSEPMRTASPMGLVDGPGCFKGTLIWCLVAWWLPHSQCGSDHTGRHRCSLLGQGAPGASLGPSISHLPAAKQLHLCLAPRGTCVHSQGSVPIWEAGPAGPSCTQTHSGYSTGPHTCASSPRTQQAEVSAPARTIQPHELEEAGGALSTQE